MQYHKIDLYYFIMKASHQDKKNTNNNHHRNSRTLIRRMNSKTMEVHSVGELISQSYHLKISDLKQGFRDSNLHIQQVNDALNIQVFYPQDVIELKK